MLLSRKAACSPAALKEASGLLARPLSARPAASSAQSSSIQAGLVHLPSPDQAHKGAARCLRGGHLRTSAATLERSANVEQAGPSGQAKPLRVIIAGAGISGLALAVALLKKGVDVVVLERDLTAIRGEGKYRGPIQVQSNALAALEAIDLETARDIMKEGCITGDRINGLCDGETGDWYVKFDTFHPAVDRGLPVTRVISRITLQQILARAVEKYGGPDALLGNSHVVGFTEGPNPETGRTEVRVELEDGREFTGDMLVGADGIWSKIRKALVGETKPSYSQYTCYTGISDFTPADIELVGYRVFLGNGKYFVSSDVGGGKMQWYGFHKEEAGGTDEEGTRKQRLLDIFGHWCDNVTDLVKATPEEDILRRDIYDRPPIFSWSKGQVALIGDSAHAMQPNLGQGGCMAIEDAFKLATDISERLDAVGGDGSKVDVQDLLKQYGDARIVRVSAIHGLAGFAAIMASTYKAYLGEGLGPLSWITKFQIPHPGRVAGQFWMNATMPGVLEWVLGGYVDNLSGARAPACLLSDKTTAFTGDEFELFLKDNDALVRATNADWILLCERSAAATAAAAAASGAASLAPQAAGVPAVDPCSTSQAKGVFIGQQPTTIGRGDGCGLKVVDIHVAEQHAEVWKEGKDYFLRDLGTSQGTWINSKHLPGGTQVRLNPGDLVEFGRSPSHEPFKVKLQHVSLRNDQLSGETFGTITVGRRPDAQQAERESALAA